MGPESAVLDAHGLTKAFDGHTVLDAVDLEVREGEFIAVMGPSGSGKSTLLYTISGLDSMTSGSVRFAGQDLCAMDQRQVARLRLTTMNLVFQHAYLRKEPVPARQHRAADLPRRPRPTRRTQPTGAGAHGARRGGADLADRDVTEASGGQLQRIGICRALINQPRILLGAEPTGALDSAAANEIMGILGQLNDEGTTIMLVTHDPTVAARTSRVLYLVDGRIIGDRQQGRYDGTDLERRQHALSEWLLDHRT